MGRSLENPASKVGGVFPIINGDSQCFMVSQLQGRSILKPVGFDSPKAEPVGMSSRWLGSSERLASGS